MKEFVKLLAWWVGGTVACVTLAVLITAIGSWAFTRAAEPPVFNLNGATETCINLPPITIASANEEWKR